MPPIIKIFLVPLALMLTWISFAFLDLKSSDGNTDLLQKGTSVLYESYENIPIHCGAYPKLQECIDGALRSPFKKTVLFGNSQLHAINNISEDAELVALRLFKGSLGNNEYSFTISYGNANFEEIFWAFEEVLSKIEIKRIYLACVFDDMRETGLRPEMIEKSLNNKDSTIKANKLGALFPEIPLQDISEKAIQDFFTDTPAWNTRHELKYKINVNLRSIRNKIFGITPETKRKVLPYAYERNIEYLSKILKTASKNNTEVILYIAPILQDSDIPHIEEEYSSYKIDIENIAKLNNAKFYNFEEIVPNEAWGLKQSTQFNSKLEKDYMHFGEKGHTILASELIKLVQNN